MSNKLTKAYCSAAILALLVLAALGPATWVPRSGLGWQIDHFVGYFVFTVIFCLAWPRPILVGGALAVFAFLLESLQVLTPDRAPDLQAALFSVGGVLTAVLPVDLFFRALRPLNGRAFLIQPFFRVARAISINSLMRLLP
jgi:VanZ family protein